MTRSALVVEDDDLMSRLIQFILQGEGYTVTRAVEARCARELIAHDFPPDLVTLDLMLPDGTGVELLELIRHTADWKHVPVLMLSAAREDNALAGALPGGTFAFMRKPFRPEELRACIGSAAALPRHLLILRSPRASISPSIRASAHRPELARTRNDAGRFR